MTDPGDVPPEVLDRLRPICLGLPETYEEPAWVGLRWRIRQRTFAHVLTADPGHQMAYTRAAATDDPVCVLTFRSPADEIGGLIGGGHPFFKLRYRVLGVARSQQLPLRTKIAFRTPCR